mgnify:CR=1 FL=1
MQRALIIMARKLRVLLITIARIECIRCGDSGQENCAYTIYYADDANVLTHLQTQTRPTLIVAKVLIMHPNLPIFRVSTALCFCLQTALGPEAEQKNDRQVVGVSRPADLFAGIWNE